MENIGGDSHLRAHIHEPEPDRFDIYIKLEDLIVEIERYKQHVSTHRTHGTEFATEVLAVMVDEFTDYNTSIVQLIKAHRGSQT